jgi:hypothetical protein
MSTALVPIESMKGVEIFKPGAIDLILDRIEKDAREEAAKLDISTDANRKALASLAYKVARSKTYIDEEGKALGEDLRDRLGKINDERKRARERMEALKDEVRKPLTDYENADKARIAAHEATLAEIDGAKTHTAANWQLLGSECIADRIREIENDPRNWQEFDVRAAGVKAVALNSMRKNLADAQKYEAEQAELARHRAEAAERAIKEREEAAARAATEAAERKAKEAAEAAQRAAEAEQRRLEREKADAEERAQRLEAQRVADEANARRREQEAAAEAVRAQERAVEAERQRVAAVAVREKADADARERNKTHRAAINRAARDAFVGEGLATIAEATAIVKAIAEGKIPNVTIAY